MSLSPEGRRRLIRALGLRAEDQKDFTDSLDRLMGSVSNQPEGFTPFSGCPPAEITPLKFDLAMPGGVFRVNAGSLIGPNCRCTMGPLPRPRNWPSETTLSTNMLHRTLRGEQRYMFDLSKQPPAARRSPARLKEAVSWWFARAETRRVIERMLQP